MCDLEKMYNYINGELKESKSGKFLDVYEPATGKVYAQTPDSDASDVDEAIMAAQKAFDSWSKTSVDHRHRILSRIADEIERKLDFLAAAESKDNGKPLSLAKKVDIPRAADNFRFFANAITQFSSETHEMIGLALNYTLREPLGVVAAISPWNLPLYLFSWKIAPALATGNCVIAKPSEVTPYTAYLLSQICIDAGLPPGVLNILHGLGHKVGSALTNHKKIKAISFTGSTKVGQEIAAIAAPAFKKVSLEMGGKNPNIIFADADYDRMLRTTLRSSFANQGQICLCGSRIFVEASIFEKFKKDFVAAAKQLKVAQPEDPDAKISAVVSEAHMNKILDYIALAKEEGGELLAGGNRARLSGKYADGWYVEPTIFEGLAYNCRVNQEEIFGPVVSITPFETEEEVLMMANSTEYGLSATLWTQNLDRAHRMAKEIDAGIVWINTWLLRDLRTPFGGVKHSGVGREGGLNALRFFTEQKNICIKYN